MRHSGLPGVCSLSAYWGLFYTGFSHKQTRVLILAPQIAPLPWQAHSAPTPPFSQTSVTKKGGGADLRHQQSRPQGLFLQRPLLPPLDITAGTTNIKLYIYNILFIFCQV